MAFTTKMNRKTVATAMRVKLLLMVGVPKQPNQYTNRT
jgi:hypothetical protein